MDVSQLYFFVSQLVGVLAVFSAVCFGLSLYLLVRYVGMMDDVRFIRETLKRLHGGAYRKTPVVPFLAGFVAFFALAVVLAYYLAVTLPSLSASGF